MFRLADFAEGTPLYSYLSAVASETIHDALNGWIAGMSDVEEIYTTRLAAEPVGMLEEDFFQGLSRYLAAPGGQRTLTAGMISPDAKAGIELMYRKFHRMKEKMADQDKDYTFDLFEEFLFSMMIDFYQGFEELIDGVPSEAQRKRVSQTAGMLTHVHELDPEEAEDLAEQVCNITRMGPDDSDLFFWDTDYALVFKDGFVKGIRTLVTGMAAILGYGYEDVCSIFTDIGIKAPLLLVGTEAAFDLCGENARERQKQAMEEWSDKIMSAASFDAPRDKDEGDDDPDGDTDIDDDDLPFD